MPWLGGPRLKFRVGIAAVGDSEDVATWSGTPHYLLRAGRRREFLTDGLNLRIGALPRMRLSWQARQVLKGRRPRGFQYSPSFLRALGNRAVEECGRLGVGDVISHYQLLPGAECLRAASIRTSFYIDSTLHDLFATHSMLPVLDRSTVQEALHREREEYHAAFRVVTMARWAGESLERLYGLPKSSIHNVLAGANLPEESIDGWLFSKRRAVPADFNSSRPLRIGFTGKNWERKGLPRLVGAAEILERMGMHVEIVAIGPLAARFRGHPRVRATGFLDKATEMDRFVEALLSCDIGCAPSYEEPMGIAPLEFLRLGVPVVCTAVGGLVDILEAAGSASLAISRDVTAEELAQHLEPLVRDPARLQAMSQFAWRRKEHFSWDRTVAELKDIWKGDADAKGYLSSSILQGDPQHGVAP